MKKCTKCRSELPLEMFSASGSAADGRASWCRKCKREAARRYQAERRKKPDYFVRDLVDKAGARARKAGVPYDAGALRQIAQGFADRYVAGEVVPCPYLGIPLKRAKGRGGYADGSPSVDRVVPEEGYVEGNILIVSRKANAIKNIATPDELERIARAIREHQQLQELLS